MPDPVWTVKISAGGEYYGNEKMFDYWCRFGWRYCCQAAGQKGDTVHVIEKQPHVGGNCYDGMSQAGVTIHKYGPHIFHTNMTEVWDFCQRFADFNFYQHRVMSYVDGQLLPFLLTEIRYVNFGIDIGIREIEGFLADEVARSTYKNPPENFRDAVISQVGTYLYEKFFHNYTRKQWAAEPESCQLKLPAEYR